MATILVISGDGGSVELAREALVTAGHQVLVASDAPVVHHGIDVALIDRDRSALASKVRRIAARVMVFSDSMRGVAPRRLREEVERLLSEMTGRFRPRPAAG